MAEPMLQAQASLTHSPPTLMSQGLDSGALGLGFGHKDSSGRGTPTSTWGSGTSGGCGGDLVSERR